MNARKALKTIQARLDDRWPGDHVEDALDTLEQCVEALETLVAYVENRRGHAKPYAPAMGRARAVLGQQQRPRRSWLATD